MNKETAKKEVQHRTPDFLTPAKKKVNKMSTYVCPVCGNGSGKDGDGITLDPKADIPHWKCFRCGLYADIIGLWKAHTGYTDSSEVFRTIYEHYGIDIDYQEENPEFFRTGSKTAHNPQTRPFPKAGNIGYGETGWMPDEELTEGKQSEISFRGGSCGKADAPPKYVIEGFKREINQHEPEFYKTGWNKSSFEHTKATADELEGLTTFQKLQVIFGNVDEVEALAGTQLFWDWFRDKESYEKKFDAIRIELEATSDFTQPRQPVKDKPTLSQSQGARNEFDGLSVTTAPISQEIAQQQDYSNFFLKANKNLSMTDYHRGISRETLNRFCVGFVPNWRHPKAPDSVPTSPRLIIPTSDSSYLARDTRENLTATQKKYSKSKVGSVHIFNVSALQTADKPIFVVEGEIDAMSIIDVGGEAVAIGSTANVNLFLNCLKEYEHKPTLILLLDNDTAGTTATEKLIEGLQDMGVTYYQIDVVAPYKDANEALTADRQSFADKIEEATLNPEQSEQLMQEVKYMESSVTAHLQDFLDGIAQSVNTPYISTGFPVLDTVLDGGLYEGLYIAGAISSLGKTTLFTQICDQIAQGGDDVLIFSLEMARAELMAKTLSRLTCIDVINHKGNLRNAKTTRGITTGSRYANYSQAEKDLIQRAVTAYQKFSDHVFIHEGIGDIGVDRIREVVDEHISITGRKPVVLIDYLQILAPHNVRATDKQNTDKAVLELKRISRDFKIPIIGISSFNRENYSSPVNLTSFKESGAIEYSSDVLIGLQLKGTGNSNFDATKAKAKNPREVELVILKNRNGQTGKKIAYHYYPMFNYFEEKGIVQESI